MDIVECVIRAAQNGYGHDINHLVSLNRETWAETQLWDAIKDLPHGKDGKTRVMFNAFKGNLQRLRWLAERGADFKKLDLNLCDTFMWACRGGQLDIVRYLHEEKHVSLKNKCSKNKSAFHYACESGNLQLVEYLYPLFDPMECSLGHEFPTHFAVHHIPVLEFLLSKMDNMLDTVAECGTMLHKAVSHELLHTVDFLLLRGVDLNSLNSNGETPLMIASDIGNVRIMEKLIDKGANVLSQDLFGYTALHIATSKQHFEACKLLMNTSPQLIHITDDYGTSCLQLSCSVGNNIVTALLAAKSQLEHTDIEGCTAMHYAINHEDSLQLLIDMKANLDAVDNAGRCALVICAEQNLVPSGKLLIKRGCNLNLATYANEMTALHVACLQGHLDFVKILLYSGRFINLEKQTLFRRFTPLLFACKYGQREIVAQLVVAGCNINASSSGGNNCLIWAVQSGYHNIVNLLIKFGANPNFRNPLNGYTPLMVAVTHGKLECVKALIKGECSLEEETEDGSTALYLASWKTNALIVEYLLTSGANSNVKTNNGHTCLHAATENRCRRIVELLCSWGANVNAQNSDGKKPADIPTSNSILEELAKW
jgi:ankyrin repeat protein